MATRDAAIQGKMICEGKSLMPQEVFSILAVCTGNVCRSPAVERLLASKLGPTVSVSSAGTHALVGHPISEPMAALLRTAALSLIRSRRAGCRSRCSRKPTSFWP